MFKEKIEFELDAYKTSSLAHNYSVEQIFLVGICRLISPGTWISTAAPETTGPATRGGDVSGATDARKQT
jgi:hypothetical protein